MVPIVDCIPFRGIVKEWLYFLCSDIFLMSNVVVTVLTIKGELGKSLFFNSIVCY